MKALYMAALRKLSEVQRTTENLVKTPETLRKKRN